jgi:hypothetical protein
MDTADETQTQDIPLNIISYSDSGEVRDAGSMILRQKGFVKEMYVKKKDDSAWTMFVIKDIDGASGEIQLNPVNKYSG